MDSYTPESRKSIVEWDEEEVQSFLSKLGYPQYETQVREHNISGDVLCMLDPDGLKEVGIATVGQRLAILKAVYMAKLAHNVAIEPEHYVPPSEAEERSEITLEKLYDIVKEQGERLHTLEEENIRLRQTLQIRSNNESPIIRRQPSFKWAQYKAAPTSPTKSNAVESPHPSPQRLEYDLSHSRNSSQPQAQASSADRQRASPSNSSSNLIAPPKPTRQDSSDNLKSFKVSLDDPAWKVLPAALKKYKINNDDWQNYAMFICYGPSGNRIERCLSYDEKPLLLFQKLKDAKKNPVFMLKHIKDIRSPIVVAQQKHAARKASAEASAAAQGQSKSGSSNGQTKPLSRPPKLQVTDPLNASTPPVMTANASQPGWPELLSPVDGKDRSEEGGGSASASGSNLTPGSASALEAAKASALSAREGAVASTGVSYAVAIYPYMAEQEDEFDVVVGDTFIILSRARGWWVVQRDPAGTGAIEPDMSKQGWVPAGCLLETNIPVASAVAEANATRRSNSTSDLNSPSNNQPKRPILPLSIVSTSFPGIALMDYQGKGDEELDLVKDDVLRVFKRYNHWSYAVKEDGGDRGWVPSWYIGKVSSAGGTPATPSVAAPTHLSSVALDADSRPGDHPSPMSSAFPPAPKVSVLAP